MFVRSSNELANTLSVGDKGASPLDTFCSSFFPTNRDAAFRVAEFAWDHISMYRSGLERIISYFLTDIQLEGLSGQDEEYWDDLLNSKAGIYNKMKVIAEDKQVYGNSFSSVIFPFTRVITCQNCYLTVVGEKADYRVDEGKFIWKCVKCKHEGEVRVEDRLNLDPPTIHTMRWDPYAINIRNFNPITDQADYYWNIPSSVQDNVNEGGPLLSQMPKSIVVAASKGEEFKFSPNAIKHLKHEGLAGVRSKANGWGVPPILSLFSDLWFRQLINKFDQAVALDYLIPMRIVTPAARGRSAGEGTEFEDPSMGAGMGGMNAMMARLEEMVSSFRDDPTGWYALPFEVRQGALGGEGIEMLQPAVGEYADSKLLSGMGVPEEFYQANLQWKATPEAMRVMERCWQHLPQGINSWINFFLEKVSIVLSHKPIKGKLAPPSIQDDMMRKEILLNMYQRGDVSREKAISQPWNINFEGDDDNIMEEKRQQIDLQKRMESEFEAEELAYMLGRQPPEEGQPGGPAGGPAGEPAGGGMGGMVPGLGGGSLPEMEEQATHLAEQLLGMPAPARDSELRALKAEDPTLHALVTAKIKDSRSQVDREGAIQHRQQVYGEA